MSNRAVVTVCPVHGSTVPKKAAPRANVELIPIIEWQSRMLQTQRRQLQVQEYKGNEAWEQFMWLVEDLNDEVLVLRDMLLNSSGTSQGVSLEDRRHKLVTGIVKARRGWVRRQKEQSERPEEEFNPSHGRAGGEVSSHPFHDVIAHSPSTDVNELYNNLPFRHKDSPPSAYLHTKDLDGADLLQCEFAAMNLHTRDDPPLVQPTKLSSIGSINETRIKEPGPHPLHGLKDKLVDSRRVDASGDVAVAVEALAPIWPSNSRAIAPLRRPNPISLRDPRPNEQTLEASPKTRRKSLLRRLKEMSALRSPNGVEQLPMNRGADSLECRGCR